MLIFDSNKQDVTFPLQQQTRCCSCHAKYDGKCTAKAHEHEEITQYGLWFSQILCQSAICIYLYFSFSYGNTCTGKFAESVMNTIKRSLTAMANHTNIT